LSGEEEGWPKILLKSSPKGKMKGVRKQNVVLKYIARTGKGMNLTERKKESALSMWVLLITIMVGVIILGRFMFFSG